MNKLSIRKRYFISIALVSMISLVIVSGISYFISYKLFFDATKSEVEMASQRYSIEIESWLSSQTDRLSEIAEDVEINSSYYTDDDNMGNMLMQKLENAGGNVMDYYVGFKDKRLLSGTGWNPPADYDCTSRDWYIQAIKNCGIVYTLPYVDSHTKKMVITISEPVTINGEIVGVLAKDITLDYLVELVKRIEVTRGSHAFLIDNQKNIMTFPDDRFLPTDKQSYRMDQIQDGRYIQIADQIDSGTYKLIQLKDYEGKDNYFFVSEISSQKWKLVFLIPTSAVTENMRMLLLGFAFSFAISIIISMIVIFFITKKMLSPILRLTETVIQFGEKKMNVRCEIGSTDEVGELGKSFNNMADIIQNHSITLENKVEERTRELNEKNLKIQDSIEYAKMIQQTILPDDDEMRKLFKDYFVIWNPRDVVGGDFYWMRKFEDGFLIVVGDCTGHGVPGALMTMAVNSILNHIVEEMCHDDPAFILNEMSPLLVQSLGRGRPENNIQDGLDAGAVFVSIDGKMLYAASRIALISVRDGEVIEIKGDRHTIGPRLRKNQKKFENEKIDMEPGTSFYLATDGVIGQMGGEERLPFGKKRLLSLLKSIQRCPMEEQKKIIWSAFEEYKKEEILLDDVTIMGFRL